MAALTFTMIFTPLMICAMAAVGLKIGLKKRAISQQQRTLQDQQRFLRKGYLRKGWQ